MCIIGAIQPFCGAIAGFNAPIQALSGSHCTRTSCGSDPQPSTKCSCHVNTAKRSQRGPAVKVTHGGRIFACLHICSFHTVAMTQIMAIFIPFSQAFSGIHNWPGGIGADLSQSFRGYGRCILVAMGGISLEIIIRNLPTQSM